MNRGNRLSFTVRKPASVGHVRSVRINVPPVHISAVLGTLAFLKTHKLLLHAQSNLSIRFSPMFSCRGPYKLFCTDGNIETFQLKTLFMSLAFKGCVLY